MQKEENNREFRASTLFLNLKKKRKCKRTGLDVDRFDEAIVRKAGSAVSV
jgi:hypothetical protein